MFYSKRIHDDHLYVNHMVRMVYEIVLSLSLLATLFVDLDWVALFAFFLLPVQATTFALAGVTMHRPVEWATAIILPSHNDMGLVYFCIGKACVNLEMGTDRYECI
ncbi:uncharacterized protein APUU_80406S [Aspergillus puulaauensis]|uniref:Uncharacterized protein n=1 Tax=Aspergillus puulaauensis TaxID=1220207 RepID=A0A7R7Y033_9EURO|nr:uncharacterized protein APUU_80406S [Aspergillus puulaauensis]BCS30103.1 hypothetical protein APUU_80406S [Aspergillus puulaauensis]